jgi:hypothetical protein
MSMRVRHLALGTMAVLLSLAGVLIAAEPAPAPAPAAPDPVGAGAVYSLEQFGKYATPAAAQELLDSASAQVIAKGGGVILIPPDAPAGWTPRNNTQEQWRKPAPPEPTRQWGAGPGVTVIDTRGGTVKVITPQTTGLNVNRSLKLPLGQSLPHWDYFPMVNLNNAVARGSTSYRDQVLADAVAGSDVKLYVNTIRGLFPGMFINLHSRELQRIYIKSLGFDSVKGLWYITADLVSDVRKGEYLSNKNHVNVINSITSSHNENQTFDLFVQRFNYSQGDNYLIDARMKYMSDLHSTGGDENNVLYAGFVESMSNIFRATVESWTPASGELVYKGGGAQNAGTLGSGRPIINLNPQKWINQGNVWIVRPASYTEIDDPSPNPVFAGKSYPTTLGPNKAGTNGLLMGGLIRFSMDAPVDASVIGRYFAVDEPSEMVAGTKDIRRWYLIDSVTVNEDGTKDIRIIRHWWGARPAGSPTLYKPENYSTDSQPKPLKYIIAPGVNAWDVADGLESKLVNPNGHRRLLRLAPAPFAGTPVDFAAGDAIEQAIGPDPFPPISFRSWLFEKVPGAFPAPIFDIANHGEVQRAIVLHVKGGSGKADDDMAKRYDRDVPWNQIIRIDSASNTGIVFMGDTTNAAIQFQQKNGKAQPIKWRFDEGRKEASLVVDPVTGVMTFNGNGIATPGGLTQVGGLSGTATAAANFRGIAVPVKAGLSEFTVTFGRPEPDDQYAVFVQTNWLTAQAVVKQTAEGFTVQFEKPAAANAQLHWLLVR